MTYQQSQTACIPTLGQLALVAWETLSLAKRQKQRAHRYAAYVVLNDIPRRPAHVAAPSHGATIRSDVVAISTFESKFYCHMSLQSMSFVFHATSFTKTSASQERHRSNTNRMNEHLEKKGNPYCNAVSSFNLVRTPHQHSTSNHTSRIDNYQLPPPLPPSQV